MPAVLEYLSFGLMALSAIIIIKLIVLSTPIGKLPGLAQTVALA